MFGSSRRPMKYPRALPRISSAAALSFESSCDAYALSIAPPFRLKAISKKV
jgi:hypothetical protein